MRMVQGELVCVGDSAVVCVRQEAEGGPGGHPGTGPQTRQAGRMCGETQKHKSK